MKYTVIWTSDAEDELAVLWINAADRQAVTQAALAIDQQLRFDAHTKGESRVHGLRLLFEPPLACHFTVDEPDRKVFVQTVWSTER